MIDVDVFDTLTGRRLLRTTITPAVPIEDVTNRMPGGCQAGTSPPAPWAALL